MLAADGHSTARLAAVTTAAVTTAAGRSSLPLLAGCCPLPLAALLAVDRSVRILAQQVDNVKYGQWDKQLYGSAHMEDIKAWLLDEDAVPTEWDELIRIRAQHAA